MCEVVHFFICLLSYCIFPVNSSCCFPPFPIELLLFLLFAGFFSILMNLVPRPSLGLQKFFPVYYLSLALYGSSAVLVFLIPCSLIKLLTFFLQISYLAWKVLPYFKMISVQRIHSLFLLVWFHLSHINLRSDLFWCKR